MSAPAQDTIEVGDRVSFRWPGDARLFGVVDNVVPWQDHVGYGVQIDGGDYDVWPARGTTKECG